MFLVFDTESNDLLNYKLPADHPEQARIVQIAAILVGPDLEPIAEHSAIIKPDGWTIAEGAQKVHGISLERCHDEGVPIAEAIEAFDALDERCETLCGFNMDWDLKFIRGERRRVGRDDQFGTKRKFDVMHKARPFCGAKDKNGRAKAPTLSEAVRALCGESLDDAHDAMADVRGTLGVLRALRDKHRLDITGEYPVRYADSGRAVKLAPQRKPSLTPHVPVGHGVEDDTDFFNG